MAKKHFYEFESIMKRMEEETKATGKIFIDINTIQRLLRDTPTIEAVPVVHGEWFDIGSMSCRCNQCGCKNIKDTRFCPNRGADMRKKV